MNDNRNYSYSHNSSSRRGEYEIIASWIPSGSQVIDLGCGDGTLLTLLKGKRVQGEGLEISESGVKVGQGKGLKVTKGRIDTKLDYKDGQFNFAVCNVTLQMVMYPEVLLEEMVRISRKQIISFPNFAFILNRLDLLLNGRMPRFMLFGYDWYSTGHIHQLSVRDFEEFCRRQKIKITGKYHFFPKQLSFVPRAILERFPDLLATTSIYLLS